MLSRLHHHLKLEFVILEALLVIFVKVLIITLKEVNK